MLLMSTNSSARSQPIHFPFDARSIPVPSCPRQASPPDSVVPLALMWSLRTPRSQACAAHKPTLSRPASAPNKVTRFPWWPTRKSNLTIAAASGAVNRSSTEARVPSQRLGRCWVSCYQLPTIKNGNALDVRGMREHVDHASGSATVTRSIHQ